MSVLKPRSRMISVRLSEDEYADLTRLCSLTGARSLSDLTRDAVHGMLIGRGRNDSPPNGSHELHTQMQILNQKLEELVERLSIFVPETNR